MPTDVAVGYAVCYIFGSLGPIIIAIWIPPLVMKLNVGEEVAKVDPRTQGSKHKEWGRERRG